MTVDKITPKFIEKLLKKWQKGNFSTEELAILQFPLNEGKKLEEQRLSLREWLFQHVQAQLSEDFLEAVTSQNQVRIVQEVKKVFRGASSDLQYFTLIHCRYLCIQKYAVKELSDHIGISTRTLRRYILMGFENLSMKIKKELAQKTISYTNESIKDHFPTLAKNQVVGIDEILAEINAYLENKASLHALSIEGIGGIGKTLLTQHILEAQIDAGNFQCYAWVSAVQKEILPSGEIADVVNFATTLDDVVARLAHQLGQNHLAGLSTQDKLKELKKLTDTKSFLIIIDNLETLEDADSLVPELLKLTCQSTLLFTSRKSLSQYANLRAFPIPELSFEDSYALVDGELRRRGLSLTLPDEIIRALYKLTGGIPLVLKLATAQFGFLPAKDIIQQLRLGEENAQYIY